MIEKSLSEIQGMKTRENNLLSALKSLTKAYSEKLDQQTIICLNNEISKSQRVINALDEVMLRIEPLSEYAKIQNAIKS